MFTSENDKQVTLDDLRYYFDAQEKNAIDFGSFAVRAGQVLHVRQRLLSLPAMEFDRAIGAIEKIIAHPRESGDSDKTSTRRDAISLFERASGLASHSAIDEVSRV